MITPNNPAIRPGSHAVVIGSSMAGLFAAHVVSRYVDRVTLIERDRLPDAPVFRGGVPQARHVHNLLARGRTIMEAFLPGLSAELVAAGAREVNWPGDLAWFGPAGWGTRVPSRTATISCSRDLIEWVVRGRVLQNERIALRTGYEVTHLRIAGTTVVGVDIRPRTTGGDVPQPEFLAADLVVDASGRSSRAPAWLAAWGYPQPEETVVDSFIGYSSRIFQQPPDIVFPWKLLVVQGKPSVLPRNGIVCSIEGDRVLVTLAGADRQFPPTDEDGWAAFARSLPTSAIADVIEHLTPLGPVHGYRRTANRWVHYERLHRWPAGFVVLGDAVCAFNPVYGQGMTMVAIAAQTLDQCLARHPEHLAGAAQRFQRQLSKELRTPWMMATGEDFRHASTEGGKPNPLTRLFQRYMDQTIVAARQDVRIFHTFIDVMHLVEPPAALLRVPIMGRVVKHAVTSKWSTWRGRRTDDSQPEAARLHDMTSV